MLHANLPFPIDGAAPLGNYSFRVTTLSMSRHPPHTISFLEIPGTSSYMARLSLNCPYSRAYVVRQYRLRPDKASHDFCYSLIAPPAQVDSPKSNLPHPPAELLFFDFPTSFFTVAGF